MRPRAPRSRGQWGQGSPEPPQPGALLLPPLGRLGMGFFGVSEREAAPTPWDEEGGIHRHGAADGNLKKEPSANLLDPSRETSPLFQLSLQRPRMWKSLQGCEAEFCKPLL